jgi:hypothetical protein
MHHLALDLAGLCRMVDLEPFDQCVPGRFFAVAFPFNLIREKPMGVGNDLVHRMRGACGLPQFSLAIHPTLQRLPLLFRQILRFDPAVAFDATDEPASTDTAALKLLIISREGAVGVANVGVKPHVLAGFDVDHTTGLPSVRNIR